MLFVACNKGSSKAGPPSTKGFGTAHITYLPNVHVVEQEEGANALIGVSTRENTLVFETTNPQILSLKGGDVLLIKGLLARKVIATQVDGNRLAVLVEPAKLQDIIKEGQIRLSAPVRFGTVHASKSSHRGLIPVVYAQAPDIERMKKAQEKGTRDAYGNLAKGAVKSLVGGWETTFSAIPSGGKLNITITMTKSVGGFVAKIDADGYIADFDLDSGIDVQRGVVDTLQMTYKRVNGAMNFTWQIAKDSPGGLTETSRIKLPAAVEIPLYQYLGGFPLFLEVSAATVITPSITGGKEFSHGAFHVTFDGYQNLRVKEGNVDTDGNLKGDLSEVEQDAISATAPLGMNIAFAAPRIELSVGVSKVAEMKDMKLAAEAVDRLEEQLVKRVLGKDAWQTLQNSPLGQITMGKAVNAALGSDAAAYLEVITTSGMSHTGMSVLTPCSRTDLHLSANVGAAAEMFGQKLGNTQKNIFKKDLKRIEPPGTPLCENLGG
jgi:hypothetical protein